MSALQNIAIRPFEPSVNRKSFRCASEALTRYFRQPVGQDVKRRLTSCFVAVLPDGTVAGYYTLAAASIDISLLPSEETAKLPKYPLIPCVLLGRLAVDERFTGHGLGRVLLADAVIRSARMEVAAYALTVDAKDETAAAFYRNMGFKPLVEQSLKLFLKLDRCFTRSP